VLTDKREQTYQRARPNGCGDDGCYMFRLSQSEVVDATVAGSAGGGQTLKLRHWPSVV